MGGFYDKVQMGVFMLHKYGGVRIRKVVLSDSPAGVRGNRIPNRAILILTVYFPTKLLLTKVHFSAQKYLWVDFLHRRFFQKIH